MKKILFVGGLRSGGAEHQMVIIAKLMKKKGHEVTYLACGDDIFFKKDLIESGIHIIQFEKNSLTSLLKLNTVRDALVFRKILKQGQYDTVVTFLGLWNFYNCMTANKKQTKHRAITGIRNSTEFFLAPREKFYAKFERNASVIVSNSDDAKEKYAASFPELSNKLVTIYNIVDLPPITSSYKCCRDGKVHIIIPASYFPVKNPMRLLHAVSKLCEEDRSKLSIEWYGNIKSGKVLYDEMVGYINDKKLTETIRLFDSTNDIANRIFEADMVGLFSTSEGLPNAICEGMMLGKPVVMTRVSDYNVLAEGGNGFLCNSDNTQSICEALSSIARTEACKFEEMGRISLEKAKKLFSEENVLYKWEEII